MRKLIVMFAALALIAAGIAFAQRGFRVTTVGSTRAAFRAYVGATPQQYDTLGGGSGVVVVLDSWAYWADDSAQTPTINFLFVSSGSKTPYLRIADTFTANQIKGNQYNGPWAFPKDSTILVYYNITGATPGTLDTINTAGAVHFEAY